MRTIICDRCGTQFKNYKAESLKVSVFGRTNDWQHPEYTYQSFHYCKKCLLEIFGIDLKSVLKPIIKELKEK